MANYPGPYEVRFFYTVDATPGGPREHQMRLSCQLEADPEPGTLFADIDLTPRVAAAKALSLVAVEMANKIAPMFNSTDASIDRAELWKYTPLTFQADFISAHDLSIAGTSTDPTVPAGQLIATYRTFEGGVFKWTLMETAQTPGVKIAQAALTGDFLALATFFTNPTYSYWLARDTSYPLAGLGWFPGQNEHTFKDRYR